MKQARTTWPVNELPPLQVEGGYVRMLYQPQISCQTGAVVGLEALSRFADNYDADLNTQQIICELERQGQIGALDFLAFDCACRYLEQLRSGGNFFGSVSVNFSQNTLLKPDFLQLFFSQWACYRLPKHCLVIEVTETAVHQDEGRLADCLRQLRSGGISLSIDDFGSRGVAASSLVSNLYDEIKIDKCLTDKLLSNPSALRLFELMGTFCKDEGIRSVVEGIETKAQYQTICALGFDVAQGYYLAKPLSPEDCMAFCDVRATMNGSGGKNRGRRGKRDVI